MPPRAADRDTWQAVGSEGELRSLVGAPLPRVADEVRDRLPPTDRASPFSVVATASSDGRCGVSPKGDPPGRGPRGQGRAALSARRAPDDLVVQSHRPDAGPPRAVVAGPVEQRQASPEELTAHDGPGCGTRLFGWTWRSGRPGPLALDGVEC